jgi:two-component system, chemotaxis family, protein-glutamate methylesterase/glutaminase
VEREIVILGVSAGGLNAVCSILRALPADFGGAVVVVQHRSKDSTALCDVFQSCTPLAVHEAVDKAPIERGRIYVAPADYHLLLEEGHFALSLDAPELFSRPSIDVAFETAADAYGDRVVGVVLTGANRDGARGLRRIVDQGGLALVQDPETAEVRVMPAASLSSVPEAEVLPLEGIPQRLVELLGAADMDGGPAS